MEKLLNPYEYMFKFDIEQGSDHIDIYKPHQKVLGFSWEVGEKFALYLLPSRLD